MSYAPSLTITQKHLGLISEIVSTLEVLDPAIMIGVPKYVPRNVPLKHRDRMTNWKRIKRWI